MRRIVGILMFLVLLSGCEKYVVEKSDVTLSGIYNITKIVTTDDEGIDSTYTYGFCKNNLLPKPFDSLVINNFFIEFSYSDVRFNLLDITTSGEYKWEYGGNSDSTTIWTDISLNNSYFSGVLSFSYKPTGTTQYRTVVFTIVDDGLISLTLRHDGTYTNSKKHITFYLSRQ
jgi:hypothetical protein